VARVPETDGGGDVAERIRSRRPGGVLRPIDKALLHSPRVADGWNALLGTLRGGTTLRADLRELVVLRIAVLNAAAYEWSSHEADALAAGLRPDQLSAVRDDAPDPSAFEEIQLTVVALTDVMTRSICVPDSLAEKLREQLGMQQFVELVATVAAYNMVSRLVVALQIEAPEVTR
jgi:AhpD family alkylhydroperoxidase